jgi:hypothetical protein
MTNIDLVEGQVEDRFLEIHPAHADKFIVYGKGAFCKPEYALPPLIEEWGVSPKETDGHETQGHTFKQEIESQNNTYLEYMIRSFCAAGKQESILVLYGFFQSNEETSVSVGCNQLLLATRTFYYVEQTIKNKMHELQV